jgi:hypothetical protein
MMLRQMRLASVMTNMGNEGRMEGWPELGDQNNEDR